LAFPEQRLHLTGTLENVEVTLPETRADFVHQITDEEGKEFLFHLEFQVEHESDFPERMFTYAGALTQLFKKRVVSLAIYLSIS